MLYASFPIPSSLVRAIARLPHRRRECHLDYDIIVRSVPDADDGAASASDSSTTDDALRRRAQHVSGIIRPSTILDRKTREAGR